MKVGEVIPSSTVESVSAEKMKTMALLLRDPNPIHWDVEAVRALGMGGPETGSGKLGRAGGAGWDLSSSEIDLAMSSKPVF